MSSFFRAWVSGGAVFTVCSSPKPLIHNTYDGPCEFIIDGEVSGDFMDAAAIMGAVSVEQGVLVGLPFVSQEISQGVAEQPSSLVSWRQSTSCSRMQGILALGQVRWATIQTYKATATWAEQVVIDGSGVWYRNSQNIAFFAYLLNLSDTEVDDLFRLAITITA